MTRINVGISPSELCDQHLIAEYRELPRMAALSHQRAGDVPDVPFALGKGHMLSCVRYGFYLSARHHWIVEEMRHRGFSVSNKAIMHDSFHGTCQEAPSIEWVANAIDIVRARILGRLATMKRAPRWTNRTRPVWAVSLTPEVSTETK